MIRPAGACVASMHERSRPPLLYKNLPPTAAEAEYTQRHEACPQQTKSFPLLPSLSASADKPGRSGLGPLTTEHKEN